MKRFIAAMLAVAAAAATTVTAQAQQSRTEVGVLECDVAGGVGLILGSSKKVSCTFFPAEGTLGVKETYEGEISKLGIDIGVTERSFIKWLVFAPSKGYAPRALAGTYVGASGEATIGVGLGANALIGGSDRTIALQPISVQAQTGLNLAVGIASLTLR